ncbi:MAG: methyltransferase [Lachnotalea sp.]
MIEELYTNIENGNDLRKNLSNLRKEIKEKTNKLSLLYKMGNNYNVLMDLLDNEDAKVRKNAALLLGELEIQEALDALFNKYKNEDKLFIKSSYIIGMSHLNCEKYLKDLKERVKDLSKEELTAENKKHISGELKELTDIIVKYEGIQKHKFIGYHEQSDMVLLTNRNYIDATLRQLEEKNAKAFNAGIMLQTNELDKVLPVRTYQEALFVIPGMKTCAADVYAAAKTIVNSTLLDFLLVRHEGEAPFYFRVEVKSKMQLDKKSEFAKKLAAEIEILSQRKLINNTSNYELEIRVIQNKSGEYNLLVKLFTILDDRFTYRQNVIATSIKPTNAALLVELARDYMKEDAQVLDPFCGVGIMLIERHKQVKANTMYGIDLLDEAIEGARINTDEAHQIAHYINKDFFDFTHEYLFDEVFTNMPFKIGRVTQEEIYELYYKFFFKIKEHLNSTGIIIMYSHDKEIVQKLAVQNGFVVAEMFEISMKEGTYLFILKQA